MDENIVSPKELSDLERLKILENEINKLVKLKSHQMF
jgi:hypothetical protein